VALNTLRGITPRYVASNTLRGIISEQKIF